MRIYTLLITLLLTITFGYSQSIENLEVSFYRDSILIDYDILDTANEAYSISVFSSHDNFSQALTYVKGDVGDVVNSGVSKRIIWNISEELNEFNGPIALELRGYFKALPVRFSKIPEKVKRGKKMDISWSGGRPSSGYILQLFKNSLKIDEQEVRNNRFINYPVSGKMKPGSYEVKLVSIDPDGAEVVFPLRITRKIPLGVQFAPGYVLLGLGIYLLTQPDPPLPLPMPPDPGNIGN